MMFRSVMPAVLVGVVLTLLNQGARADMSWTFTTPPASGCTTPTGANIAYNDNVFCAASGTTPSVTATGWSNTGDSATSTSAYLAPAFVTPWDGGGLGVVNHDGVTANTSPCPAAQDCAEGVLPSTANPQSPTATPEHAIDNNGRYDAVLVQFGDKVQLSGIKIGYMQTDADITVLAFTDTTNTFTPTPSATTSYADLLTHGWSLVGNYADLTVSSAGNTSNPDVRKINDLTPTNSGVDITTNASDLTKSATPITSQYWLIGAYNPLVNVGNTPGANINDGNDNVKILGLYAQSSPPTTKAPEPDSLALVLLAITTGAFFARKKRSASRGTRDDS